MAGIAASLCFGRSAGSPGVRALTDALAHRGPDVLTHRLGAVELAVRAGIPVVHEPGFVFDGIAEASTLAARLAELGPAGLVTGPDPYALICATPDGLALARNGDGPPLYYTLTATHLLAASEPGALLATGVPAEPDAAVIERFLATGACDDTEATFYAGIRRVLPGQVVEVDGRARDVRTRIIRPEHSEPVTAQLALERAVATGRVGIRLGHGLAGAAALGVALARPDRAAPVPVYSATFPGLPTLAGEFAAALLGPLALGSVRHRALPFFADELDLDGLLADIGEPVPDLRSYLLWATARATTGDVDTLVDIAAHTGAAHLSRLADRVGGRYGLALRFPLHEVANAGGVLRAELAAMVERTLPATAARFAVGTPAEMPVDPPLRDVLQRMRGDLLAAFLAPRHGDARAVLRQFEALVAGRRVNAEALFRRYVLERWLRTLAPRPAPAVARPGQLAGWTRIAVVTEALGPGDKLPEKLAWYVAERARPAQPWYLLVAAKAVSVAQGRARPVWDIRPGVLARAVSRLAGRATGLATPWQAQVAADVGGRARLAAAALSAVLRRQEWYARLAGLSVRSVCGPREDGVPPADVAIVPPPAEPDRVAAEIVAALRTALPPESYTLLAGCAIVGVSDRDYRMLGWSARAAAGDVDRACPVELLAELCRDNPFGQGGTRTPAVIAVRAPRASVKRKAQPRRS